MKKQEEPTVVRTFGEAVSALRGEAVIGLDLETSGFSPWKDRAHVVALYGPESNTVAVLHYPSGVMIPRDHLTWLSSFPEVITHNGTQFDMLFLAVEGMRWDEPDLYDTLIGEQAILEVGRRDVRVNLKDTAKRRLGKTIDKDIEHGKWGNRELSDEQLQYVTSDIRFLPALQAQQQEHARNRNTLGCVEFEMGLARPVIRMELNGLPVDLDKVEAYFQRRAEKHAETEMFLRSKLGMGINLASSKQLLESLDRLYGKALFPDTKAERLMDHKVRGGEIGEVCEALLNWRNFNQRRNMFGPDWRHKFVVDHAGVNKVHGKFWQIGTNTGRFSSSDPNLQQVPRDMRDCYGGMEGWSVGKSDYAAIEVRVAAALSGDDEMIRAFNEGEDIHLVVASAGFSKPMEEITKDERSIAKAMSFTLLFGGGAETFRAYAANHGARIDSDLAHQAVDNFFERFQGIRRMRDVAVAQANSGYPRTLVYPTGLRRLIRGPELKPTTILNNIVQGTAAAGMKKAMLYAEESGVSQYLSAVVHDELVYTAPTSIIEEVRREVDRCMIKGMQWALDGTPPISIGVESQWGPTWSGSPSTEIRTESGVDPTVT